MYGSMTFLMITLGEEVSGFTLDTDLGEFVLTHPRVKLPDIGKIYSINEGNAARWDPATRRYVEEKKEVAHSLRYVGSMVADVHRTLLYGTNTSSMKLMDDVVDVLLKMELFLICLD